MEHYDGPAFYRKYRIKNKKQENRHINKISENKKHNYDRKKDINQSDIVDDDNPIAQRAAAFKPTKQSQASDTPYYSLKLSYPYQNIKRNLKQSNDDLILYADASNDSIDLDSYETSENEDLSSLDEVNENKDIDHSTISDKNLKEHKTYGESDLANNDNESQIPSDNDSLDSEENVSSKLEDDNFDQSSNDDSEEVDVKPVEDEEDYDYEDLKNTTPYSKYVDLYSNDFEYIKNKETQGKDFVAAKPDDVSGLDKPEVFDNENYYNDKSSESNDSENEISIDQDELNESPNNDNQSSEIIEQDDKDSHKSNSNNIDSDLENDNDNSVEPKAKEEFGLGHSLSSILDSENDAQKDLSLFKDDDKKTDDKEDNNLINHNYQFPSLDLLSEPNNDNDDSLDDWIESQAQKLDDTLSAFNVNANVVDWTNGPTVTQFQIKLQLGVKVSKITNLNDDLKMALAAKDIRIEAPIPGKTTVGIEIPNPHPRPVMLSEVLDSPQFKNSKDPLTVALGVDLTGKPQMTDIRKMPHGLIAGATGSGKSVFLNSLLISLLYKATPADLKLILIDPKAVEMAPYDNLPHLLSPVISDPKQASAALKWAVKEMDERYEKLAAAGARNVEQFNKMAEEHEDYGLKIPYIVIVIDELADLMMVASSEVQDYIVRITQKARAAGIHLLVATQRPSVDIITGTIKNNIPTRVAFMVSSQVDSRTIIDTAGAERLLGKGDMLYLGSGSSQATRLQGTFVTDDEIENITSEVRKQGKPKYAFQPDSLLKQVNKVEQEDDLMPQVLKYISQEDNVSTSKLQRVFSIGYNRAASLIDSLEQSNYVSGQHGSKPRDVYLTEKDYKKLNI
ncbi:DNA translocase FtsK [Apilactobacillus micheneri]|uniref:DNA translocase FtsK n=1 Tax=Apilactobacillus micheneri TaxID=1899430 RepID=A0ABY2YXH6_9LACO|nr:DNA translocase FtsK [Apilactobacillus micheneri]TPR25450.1 DNA translocase FtsK [Apilactobacillus micheneri]TPR26554.1 DNA translocase FtsK [Apilactobacillus micheneri]TPR28341.1 DNA translocase FtsK [Apilactobacillus micheneri]TPR29028.1 DNA translocase FtsK [Apilactobacillus micheneri]TPR30617.1 DNA translocase FtsK [Apilactobacillus micheneri]